MLRAQARRRRWTAPLFLLCPLGELRGDRAQHLHSAVREAASKDTEASSLAAP